MTAPQDQARTGASADDGRPQDQGTGDAAAAPGRSRAAHVAVELVETLVLTLVIFLVVQHFVAQPFQVQGPSMETTFLDGQYVLVDRLTPNWAPYARGQVVVFQPPAEVDPEGYPFIKRVIGVPGDTVFIRDGSVFVNGKALDEPYLYRDAGGTAQATEPLSPVTSWTVAPGMLFVLGDHRQVSEDSRAFGPVSISSVVGRAALRYWPLSVFGPIQTPVAP